MLSAALRVDAARIRRHLGARKLRFATPEELHELTGLVPGAVPPFGDPITPFELYVDSSPSPATTGSPSTPARSRIRCILSSRDYLEAAAPEVFEFSKE